MLVVNHDTLHGLQRDVDDVLDIVEAFDRCGRATRLFQVESKVVDGPLRTVLGVVVIALLLDCDVRQMDLHVVEVVRRHVILLVAEAGEALRAQPDLQRLVTRDKHINTQVELLAADQQRPVDVATDHVRLLILHCALETHLGGIGPFL